MKIIIIIMKVIIMNKMIMWKIIIIMNEINEK